MQKHYQHKTKILDAPMGLGRCLIDAVSLTMDGKALPSTINLNAREGTVAYVGEGAPGPYLFAFDHFAPAEVTVTADKAQITADGVEQVILTVRCEDVLETIVTLAVYCDDKKIGTFDVAVTNGAGSAAKTIAVLGTYVYRADRDTLDATWGITKFSDAGAAIVEAV